MSKRCLTCVSLQRCRWGEVKRGQTTLVPSMVDSAKATDTYGSLLSGETVKKVTIWSSSKADSHVVPWLIGKTFNDYIYDYISTYQPTFFCDYLGYGYSF